MENHEKERPKKKIFSRIEQKRILNKVKTFVINDILPDNKINKIIIFGSIAKGEFGRYEKSFKSRTYSDIDILIFTENNFNIPKKWKKHFIGYMYQVYDRIKLNRKIPIQYMICKKKIYEKTKFKKEAEKWGVPLLLNKSKNKHIIVYQKNNVPPHTKVCGL